MRPVSQQLADAFPALIGALLVFLTAVPLQGGAISYTPNIAFLMTLLLSGNPRLHWPRGVAFALGLLQDVLYGTPLGSQALLALLLAQWVVHQQARGATPLLFRVRWLEAIATLVFLHAALWLLIQAVGHTPPALGAMALAGCINGLWYPLFYRVLRRDTAPYGA